MYVYSLKVDRLSVNRKMCTDYIRSAIPFKAIGLMSNLIFRVWSHERGTRRVVGNVAIIPVF